MHYKILFRENFKMKYAEYLQKVWAERSEALPLLDEEIKGTGMRRLWALAIYHFVNDGATVVFTATLPAITMALGLTFYQVGIILSLGSITYLILQLIFGYISDRGFANGIIFIGFIGVVFSSILFPFASLFAQILLAYMLLRAFTSAYHPVGFASVSRIYTKCRTKAFGVQGVGEQVAMVTAPLFTGFVAEAYGWGAPFYVWATVGLVGLLFFLILFRGSRLNFGNGEVNAPVEESTEPPKLRSYVIIAASIALADGVYVLFMSYMPLYLTIAQGLRLSTATIIMALWFAAGIPVVASAGRIAKWFGGESRSLIVFFSLMTVLFLISNLLKSQTSWYASPLLYILLILSGTSVYICFTFQLSMIGRLVSDRKRGVSYALTLNAGVGGGTIVSYVTGYLASLLTISVVLPLLLLISAVGLIVAFTLNRMRR